MKDLPAKERSAKVREYLAAKKAAFEAYKEKMRGKAKVIVQYVDSKGRTVGHGMAKAQQVARKVERHMPRPQRSSGSMDLFGDMSFGGGSGQSQIMPSVGSSSINMGMGSLFGSPAKAAPRKHHKNFDKIWRQEMAAVKARVKNRMR